MKRPIVSVALLWLSVGLGQEVRSQGIAIGARKMPGANANLAVCQELTKTNTTTCSHFTPLNTDPFLATKVPYTLTAGRLSNLYFSAEPGVYRSQTYGPAIPMPFVQTDISIGGGGPVFNITAYGAKCNGSTDDTAAIQAAANAAISIARGATLYTPPTGTCIIAGQLVLDNANNLTITNGARGAKAGSLASADTWRFTGAVTNPLSCKSCQNVVFEGMALNFVNTSAIAPLIEFAHSGVGNDAFNDRFIGVTFFGPSKSVGPILSLDKAIDCTVMFSNFERASVYIRGAASSANYSNNITLLENRFDPDPGTAFIQNPGTNWNLIGNAFEMGTGAPIVQFVNNFTNIQGFNFVGNYASDTVGNKAFDYFNFPAVTREQSGLNFSGGNIIGGNTNQRFLVLGNGSFANIAGNTIAGFGTAFALGKGVTLTVGANNWAATVTFMTGTPVAGSVLDNAGKTTVYGSALQSTLSISNQGTPCTNGELALSAAWGTLASVTAAVGQGQTCQWTIKSSGTGQASNPTITDTLTNVLPSAAVVCDMRMVGGTGATTLINQTTLSARAPVFTFLGLPVAGSTYFVVRRCGP
jgi:pectate lyase-like protein